MDNNAITIEILKENWKDESEFAGDETLYDLVNSQVRFEGVSTGEKAEITTILTALAAGAAFIKSIIEIIQLLKKRKERNPSVVEIESEARLHGIELQNATHEFVRALIKSILSKTNSLP